ncbi:MAG: DNA primase [Nitrososphaerales archaeon]
MLLGTEDLAKYPFLEEAREHLSNLRVSLEELGRPDYAQALSRAKERLIQAYKTGIVSEEFTNSDKELLSFHVALLLVRLIGVEQLAAKFSLAEARRVESFLEHEGKKALVSYIFRVVSGIDPEEVQEVFGGVQYEYRIPVVEYLKRAVHLHSPEWKLVNRVVSGGFVYLTTHALIRLIREEIRSMIYSRIKSIPRPTPTPPLQNAVEELRRIIKALTPIVQTTVRPTEYPPCVQHALELLQKGQNIPHYGRFLMTTYLLNIGKSVDEVVALFAKAPDFNERITRYQVEHIAGLRGGGTKYKPPSCRTLQTHTFCFKTEACDDIKNPLQFGRAKSKGGSKKRSE